MAVKSRRTTARTARTTRRPAAPRQVKSLFCTATFGTSWLDTVQTYSMPSARSSVRANGWRGEASRHWKSVQSWLTAPAALSSDMRLYKIRLSHRGWHEWKPQAWMVGMRRRVNVWARMSAAGRAVATVRLVSDVLYQAAFAFLVTAFISAISGTLRGAPETEPVLHTAPWRAWMDSEVTRSDLERAPAPLSRSIAKVDAETDWSRYLEEADKWKEEFWGDDDETTRVIPVTINGGFT
jgi:hypothetical protein